MRGDVPLKKDSISANSGEKQRDSMIPNVPVLAIGSKSASFRRQCKSFSLKDSALPKPRSSHESSRTAKLNGASSRMEATAVVASFENSSRASKPDGASKPGDPAAVQTPEKQKQKDYGRLDPNAQTPPLESRPVRVTSLRSRGILHSSSSNKLNATVRQTSAKPAAPTIEVASMVNRIKDASPPSGLANLKSLSSSLNAADAQKKLPLIKTARPAGSRKSASSKSTANLCTECKAELEGAVCFIGNDGRVSACTSRTAVRLCKNLKCANNNPESVAAVAAAGMAGPKKYLVSRRHSLPRSASSRSSKGGSDEEHAQTAKQNMHSGDAGASIPCNDTPGCEPSEEFDMRGELEDDDQTSSGDMGDSTEETAGLASASQHSGSRPGLDSQLRRRSLSVIEKQGPEAVTLRKQMMQERRQAEEWMLDYAVEGALQRLAPSKDSKVKALVEAFESVIVPQKDANTAQDCGEEPQTPIKGGGLCLIN